ncbi:S-DNA-T family DNA segregation ATPase FtsK/SpoIIIE [Gracilibacillus halotolerans]|uniref:S-DNA-T family DNA segregation ATPase FtsK/SpoIIIE n=1 Tax=Gracilibacillus halotolerans TaxID=74386 RepID=A0A841RQL9_9BACI|nr:DNA translocase FtsK [Gracilibacillus halotolerans]MBB6513666.1 S-DNA-T family DNA segregation ATPase FtsK/SpoIIIE [Gracilibacillus halotolerans]
MKWKDLRSQWNRLFNDETTEEVWKSPHEQYNNVSKSLETRVAYQYPKRKLPTSPTRQTRYSKQVTKKSETVENSSVEKRQPFKPSDIPSPVHGFRNRRKETEKLIPLTNIVKDEKIKPIQEKETFRVSNEHPFIDENVTETKSLEKAEVRPQPPIQDETEEITSINSNDTVTSQDFESERNTVTENNRNRETKNYPLNVVMTPRDKHLLRRKELMKQNEKRESEQAEKTGVVYKEIEQQPQRKTAESIPLFLLEDQPSTDPQHSSWMQEQTEILQQTFDHFRINAKVIDAKQGPTVTRFEIQPAPGVKVSKIKSLTDDIKLNLAAKDIRMEAPIPGKHAIGIEIPNERQEPVFLHKLIQSNDYKSSVSPLTVALGADIEGKPVVTDLMKMPHGLIAGATGSGKSVCINTMLISLLYKASHEDVKFLMIDPKMVELAPYNGIPHLVSPVITDVKAATFALKWAVQEMESRYEAFVEEEVRDINRFNEKMIKQGRLDKKMPYMVIIIDELADLMMSAPQDVEDAICRIAQKARACGMHLLIATQRPSVDVITGLIKANVPTRIAFSVSSQVDSRTILDTNGAEKLLGKGDMLFVENGSRHMSRIQGAFVSDQEIERVTSHVRKIAEPNYILEPEQWVKQLETDEEIDDLYEEAVDFVIDHNGASVSLLQRRFRIGYNRAARLIDAMESEGIISGQNGSKPREVLISQR